MTDDMNVIDLFCGAGGMSTGFVEAGFSIIGAIDTDKDSIETFRRNHSSAIPVLREDLETYSPKQLHNQVGTKNISVVIGGPPCQGFSTASMNPNAKPNHGPNSRFDPRNELYKRFYKFVNYFKPSAFIMENVPALKAKANGHYLKSVEKLGSSLGYSIDTWQLKASNYGVPQNRNRLFFIGLRSTQTPRAPTPTHHPVDSLLGPKYRSVGDAILDLPALKARDGSEEMPYDRNIINLFESDSRFSHDYAKWARGRTKKLKHHVSRMHSDRDLGIFKMLRSGMTSAQLSSEEQKKIPYSMKSFKDKYRRQPLLKPSTTVTAHLAKDGLYYIHPTQLRSFTPREAARLQSFRDSFIFVGSRSSVFQQVGNAVPPLLAKAIALAIKPHL